jgi:hypothetical protein
VNATGPRSKDKHSVCILTSMHNRPQHYANKSQPAAPATVLSGLPSVIHWMSRRWTQNQSQHNGGEKSNSGRPAPSQRIQSLSYVTERVS